ncbi:MAG TPA: DUF3048 domain-containing protein [Tepidiformaceae bacterium]
MKPRDFLLGGAILVAALAALAVLRLTVFSSSPLPSPTPPPSVTREPLATLPVPTPTPAPRPTYALTGQPMTDADVLQPTRHRPVAVMIDNNDAWNPPLGLAQADIVFEALVEGGITRFLSVYDSQEAGAIEPVRSARTPFLAWVAEFDALYAHVGRAETPGPANSGQQIADLQIADLDMEGGPNPVPEAFQRDPTREAPHNVVTSTGALRAAAALRGYDRPPRMGEWRFASAASAASGSPTATAIDLDFGPIAATHPSWTWDPAASLYQRLSDGVVQVDGATHQPLTATNVVVMHARNYVADSSEHVLIDNVGQGTAEVYIGGHVIAGTWRKPDNASRTRFYDAAGNEIAFTPGNTWIEVEGLVAGS